ncbi:HGGxSTG domain-containing protein [Noviluteimonas gilva]|uniref:HGGxSTG domain-containing protein n=1 Tax=Noviluteimonas gilva TaxID=2682097 RepID=UPI003CCDFAE0
MKTKFVIRCGALTQAGGKCNAKPVGACGRCKWHGGYSTGPRTDEGKEKVALNLPRVFAARARANRP